jgi:hypothetical protein
VHLANPAAIQQYKGLKYAVDRHDAFWLAQMLSLGTSLIFVFHKDYPEVIVISPRSLGLPGYCIRELIFSRYLIVVPLMIKLPFSL